MNIYIYRYLYEYEYIHIRKYKSYTLRTHDSLFITFVSPFEFHTSAGKSSGRDSYAKSAIVVLGPVAGRALACLMVGEALCGQVPRSVLVAGNGKSEVFTQAV